MKSLYHYLLILEMSFVLIQELELICQEF